MYYIVTLYRRITPGITITYHYFMISGNYATPIQVTVPHCPSYVRVENEQTPPFPDHFRGARHCPTGLRVHPHSHPLLSEDILGDLVLSLR